MNIGSSPDELRYRIDYINHILLYQVDIQKNVLS